MSIPSLFPRPPVLQQLYQEARPGRCIMCDGPLPVKPKGAPGRTRTVCGAECTREYNKLHSAVWRDLRRLDFLLSEEVRNVRAKFKNLDALVSKLQTKLGVA